MPPLHPQRLLRFWFVVHGKVQDMSYVEELVKHVHGTTDIAENRLRCRAFAQALRVNPGERGEAISLATPARRHPDKQAKFLN